MRREHFIALDSHCAFCEMTVITSSGRVTERRRVKTSIPDLTAALEAVPRPRRLTFEEGPLADWLARNLRPVVDELVVCEPRRNRLIAKESDKDDPLDSERLAALYRGGYLKPVHQTQTLERSLLKQHVSFYHDRVRDRVRLGNQTLAMLRRHGVFVSVADLVDRDRQAELLERLPAGPLLRGDVGRLFASYEFLLTQEEEIRRELIRTARDNEVIRRFERVPGIGWIRAATFFVYVDTPERFRSLSALCRYCGIGLERRHSGNGPTKVRLVSNGHRRLKGVLLGAAKSAVASANNPYADRYKAWREEAGLPPTVARRNVARALTASLWSLWKSGEAYDPERVCRPRPTHV